MKKILLSLLFVPVLANADVVTTDVTYTLDDNICGRMYQIGMEVGNQYLDLKPADRKLIDLDDVAQRMAWGFYNEANAAKHNTAKQQWKDAMVGALFLRESSISYKVDLDRMERKFGRKGYNGQTPADMALERIYTKCRFGSQFTPKSMTIANPGLPKKEEKKDEEIKNDQNAKNP
ncbi:hypothetical protein LU11_gp305 [Pseudomonas phage Lu11]|uniref:hypothetical protein n=1 Tax=Pseudomonas phage Lu11 TaxID=1161927 RepID=UPI00025F185B|nr:hypothetical protein LU11_gp305 [Pseudomonas phage Lu11]AFH14836.1 hypothetical protein Lu11_0298 [Pseudomonas phage Lu11]